MEFASTILTIALGLVIALIFNLTRKIKYLESFGFPVLQPVLFFGSPPFGWHKILVHKFFQDMHRKYGMTWTRYTGSIPCIITIDPELIRRVLVKHFDHFTDSTDLEMPENQTTLDVSRGDIWRALRKSLSPTFTSGKLKSMLLPMDDVADKLVQRIESEQKRNPTVDVKNLFQAYSLDTIARCAFGIDPNSQKDVDNDVLKYGKQILSSLTCKNWFMSSFINIILHFPFLIKYMSIFPEAFQKLHSITKQIIDERKKSKIESGDFIDRLTDILTNLEAPLTPDMIYAQGVVFFAAGFETTSNTLSTFAYNLAVNPEVQEQLYLEIQEVTRDSDGIINHETINKMHFLEACIFENLRICPPVTETDRCCTKNCTVNGVFIPKGTRIQMPIWASHHNEEFFPEPEKFIPERFLKENNDKIIPFTWRPFGGGNRACIGQRFAITEIKICMAKILNKFKLEPTAETKLKLNKGSLAFLNYDTMKIKFSPRM